MFIWPNIGYKIEKMRTTSRDRGGFLFTQKYIEVFEMIETDRVGELDRDGER